MGPVTGWCDSMAVRVCGSSLLATGIFSVEYLARSSWGNNIGGLKRKDGIGNRHLGEGVHQETVP